MMGGAAFILLKAGLSGPKTAKQAEIGVAGLLKILAICLRRGQTSLAMGAKYVQWLCWRDFRWIWLICRDDGFCYLNHSFSREIGAVCCKEMQDKDQTSIDAERHRNDYIKASDLSCVRRVISESLLRILLRWRFRRNRCSGTSRPGRVAQDLHKQQMVSLAGER